MAKTTSQNQGAFSFFDEVEKVDPLPKPRKHTLKPPEQIEAMEEEPVEQADKDLEKEKAAFDEPFQEIAVEAASLEEEIIEEQPFIIEAAVPEAYETDQPEFPGNTSVTEPAEDQPSERRSTRGRKSVKEHTIAAGMIEMPDDEVLFSKQYYSMGEVTVMFKENHSLIRYWESEFDILKPKKNGKGDRFFRPIDVKNLYLIYDLLRRRKFTIEGAREYLKNNKWAEEKFAAVQSLERIKAFFLELKATL